MAVAKMKYLNVYGPEKALRATLNAIARSACFAPEGDEAIHSAIRDGKNRYEPLLAKAKGLLKDLGQTAPVAEYVGDTHAYTRQDVDAFMEKFAGEVARRSARKTEIESELEIQERAEGLLAHMADLDIDIDEVFSVQTLKVRVGRLPKNSYVRLAYYADKGFNFTSQFNFIVYDFDGEYYWGLYFAPRESAADIDDIFKSLYFERIWVPEFVHGKPQEALHAIRQRAARLREELDNLVNDSDVAADGEVAKIRDMTAWLAMMNQLHEMKRYALVFNNTFYISGFVPTEDCEAFTAAVEAVPGVDLKEANPSQKLPVCPPVKLKNGWFSRPYQMYTEMYGLPGKHDIDPTKLVAWLDSILFGIMFADVGQGLVLGLLGYFLMYKKKHMGIGLILSRAAIFCCLFGILFGSVFGLEHLMDPIWHSIGLAEKPFEVMGPSNITIILLVSVGIGILVVSLSILISIFTKIRNHHVGEAVTSANGVAGLVFFWGVAGLLLDMMMLNIGFAGTLWYALLLIVLPLAVLYMQEPLAQLIDHGKVHIESIPDLFVSGFFELFVSVLEFLSNTLSFLRVGGFVLAHAGMMMVVMTLAEMFGPLGYGIALIIGNVFVIAMEGLLVGIQALRLSYYEVFSRFYDAGGEPFEPLVLRADTIEL